MVLNDQLIFRFEDGAVFDTEKGFIHEVNETVKEILLLINEKVNYEGIVERLCEKYNSSKKEDVVACIDQSIAMLKEKGIVND